MPQYTKSLNKDDLIKLEKKITQVLLSEPFLLVDIGLLSEKGQSLLVNKKGITEKALDQLSQSEYLSVRKLVAGHKTTSFQTISAMMKNDKNKPIETILAKRSVTVKTLNLENPNPRPKVD